MFVKISRTRGNVRHNMPLIYMTYIDVLTSAQCTLSIHNYMYTILSVFNCIFDLAGIRMTNGLALYPSFVCVYDVFPGSCTGYFW